METVELDAGDAPALHALFAEYDWWSNRDVAGVQAALEHTPLALGIRDDGDLVAAARVLTDYTYYARIYDVIVREDRRSEGVGADLLSAVVDHSALSDVNPVLICRDGLVPFYESIGFEPYPETVAHPDGDDEELWQLSYPGD